MIILESMKKVNVSRLLLIVFILCTVITGLYSAIPIYEPPSVSVVTEEIPEYQLSITNKSWVPPERILLANLTPNLEDPSWYSTEWRQKEYNARIETNSSSSILYFNNQTAIDETYTWSAHAGWDLGWPFAVLNYTELTAEWHIRVLQGNVTVDSFFTIGRGLNWLNIRGSYVPHSNTEMNAAAPDEMTLVSSASNFTETFSNMDIGILWVSLDINAAQGSIVAVDNVEVWIRTDEPLCQVTLDFQTLYNQSLFSNPSIVSQWLGTDTTYDYHYIGEELTFYLKSISSISPYGRDLMLVTRSNQTAYLLPRNYDLALGWTDTYPNDEYSFNMTLNENTSYLMNIPLPFNQVKIEVSPNRVPGTIGVNSLNRVNISRSEDILIIIPECDTFSIRFFIPGYGGRLLDIETTEGIRTEIFLDLELVPLLGILFTQQQITAMLLASIFTVLSLAILLYRWHSSKETSFLTLVPLVLFFAGLVLPWCVRTEVYSSVEYTTYLSPFLGYRIWVSNGLFLTTDSIFLSELALMIYLSPMYPISFLVLLLIVSLYDSKIIDWLSIFSIFFLIIGGIALIMIGGLPWLGFWFMLTVPSFSYMIKKRTMTEIEEPTPVKVSELQSN